MSECDLLDLASVGKIQSQGFVVVVCVDNDGVPSRIRNVSSNIGKAPFSARALRHDSHLFVGKCISECFSECAVKEMSGLLEQHPGNRAIYCSFTCNVSDLRYFVTLTGTRDGFVFEILPNDEKTFDATSHAHDLQALMSNTKCESLFESVCTIVHGMVGYDRSLVYEFQDDLSGKVVYEKIRPSLVGTIDSYMGMYFPESDIPLPARQMFMIRPLRVIFDNNADPVDIVGRQEDEKPDLSKCTLRANHPVHASYMKNMGLCCSMSIGIIVDNQLWGLVCFHGYDTPVHPQGWVTTFLESLSVPLSVCISKIHKHDFDTRQSNFASVVYNNFSNTDVFGFFAMYSPDLLRVLACDCVCIQFGDRIKSWGDADLVVCKTGVEGVSREAVGKDWAIGELMNPSRGVISMIHGDLTVVFIRKSVSVDKTWAGDPSHVKIRRPDGVLGPRGSFERYVQSGVDSLNQWNDWDKKLATYVSSRIKLLVATVEYFTKKTNNLLQAHTSNPNGNVAYITAPKASTKQPVFDTSLLSHFSHELKTPLHGISTALTLIQSQDEMTHDILLENVTDGLDCVKALTRTINAVLSIAGGGQTSVAIGANLENVSIEKFVDTLRHENVDKKNFSVTSTVDKDHGNIKVNYNVLHDTLRSIIRSSLANIDTDEGSTHVSVSCCSTHRETTMAWTDLTDTYSHRNIRNSEEALSRISDTDSWFTFSVKDSGCGIHADMIDNVLAYNDSTRITTSLKNSHQGVEVDVYRCISNTIFDLNGSIGIASTVSEGTIVSMMLPAEVVLGTGNGPSNVFKIDPGEIGTFLVVDDNAVNRKLAARLVKVAFTKTMGFAPLIKEFKDGRICIEEIKRMRDNREPIMGILMDYHMPVMSGKEATASIRQLEACGGLSKTPIFGFTADSADTVKDELIECGMDDVLPKPLSMKMLQDVCVKMMSGLVPKETRVQRSSPGTW